MGIRMIVLGAALLHLAATPALARPDETHAATPIGSPADWIASDDYPVDALRESKQGQTGFQLTINEAGHVQDCVVTQSSGVASLDAATCDRLRLRANFTPATDRSGRPVASTYRSRVNWTIPEGEAVPDPVLAKIVASRSEVVATYLVSKDGKISDCAIVKADGAMGEMIKAATKGQSLLPQCGPFTVSPFLDGSGAATQQRFRFTIKVEPIGSN